MNYLQKVGCAAAIVAAGIGGYLLAGKPGKLEGELNRTLDKDGDRTQFVFQAENGKELDKVVREFHVKPALGDVKTPTAPKAPRFEGGHKYGQHADAVARRQPSVPEAAQAYTNSAAAVPQPLHPLASVSVLRDKYSASIVLSTPGDHSDGLLGEGKQMSTYMMEPQVKAAVWTALGMGRNPDYSQYKRELDDMVARSNVDSGGFRQIITLDGFIANRQAKPVAQPMK